jgi:hypothetical protein
MCNKLALGSLAALFATALVAGCGAQLGDGGGGNGAQTDANGSGGGGGGGGGSGQIDAARPIDAAPACASGRVLYLNFDGVTMTHAATDSTQNHVAWITNASAAVPPYHSGVAGRDAEILSIVDGVKSRLAMTPISVVTQRPASGPYVMMVFGGQRTADGGTVGTQYTYATSDHDCGDTVKNDVAWVSDIPDVTYAPDLVIGALGWGVGLNGTNDPADCMCGWANACNSAAGACTISASIASTTSSGNTTCPNQNPQNEVAALSTSFCQ